MALARHLVETVSGFSFEEYVERNIFQRLGMTLSSFRQPYQAHLASGVISSAADSRAMLLYPSVRRKLCKASLQLLLTGALFFKIDILLLKDFLAKV